MKRATFHINGCTLHIYFDGETVELGRPGIAPINRSPRVTISDTIGNVTVEREVVGEVQPRFETMTGTAHINYECEVIGDVEDL